jgi:WD40 repeat protein
VRALAFLPDGRALATAADDGRIALWDVSALEGVVGGSGDGGASVALPPLAALSGHVGPIAALAAAPDRPILASGGADRTVRVWDARRRDALATLEATHPERITALAWAPAAAGGAGGGAGGGGGGGGSTAGPRLASVSDAGTLAIHSATSMGGL